MPRSRKGQRRIVNERNEPGAIPLDGIGVQHRSNSIVTVDAAVARAMARAELSRPIVAIQR